MSGGKLGTRNTVLTDEITAGLWGMTADGGGSEDASLDEVRSAIFILQIPSPAARSTTSYPYTTSHPAPKCHVCCTANDVIAQQPGEQTRRCVRQHHHHRRRLQREDNEEQMHGGEEHEQAAGRPPNWQRRRATPSSARDHTRRSAR